MLDIKRIRENLDCIKSNGKKGRKDFNLDEVVKLDDERRKILQEVEVMKMN